MTRHVGITLTDVGAGAAAIAAIGTALTIVAKAVVRAFTTGVREVTRPIAYELTALRVENTDQHREVAHRLTAVETKVDVLGTKLDDHIAWGNQRSEALARLEGHIEREPR